MEEGSMDLGDGLHVSRTSADDWQADPDVPGTTMHEVVRSDGDKCVRCWRYVHDISAEDAYAGLCGRCVEAVA